MPPLFLNYTQIEVTGGLLGALRLGFNPGELVDFILGWMMIDIYLDDLERKNIITNSGPSTKNLE